MSKSFTLLITLFFLLSALIMVTPDMAQGDSMQSPTRQPVRFYMFGPADTGNLSINAPTTDEDETEECPSSGNHQWQQAVVGSWYSEPFQRRCNFSGAVNISLWAKGDVRQVQFSIEVSRDGNNAQTFQTQTMDTESTPKLFYATGNIGINGINPGDRLQITITFNGGEENPLDAPNRQAYLVYGSRAHPSGIRGPLDSVYFDYSRGDIEVNDENAPEDRESIIVTSTIYNALGPVDLIDLGFKVETHGFTGQNYESEILETTSNSVRIKWKWMYGNEHAPSGRYELNLTATDTNGNPWWKTQEIQIITQVRPKIDFVLDDSDLATDPPMIYTGNNAEIIATVHCYGESGLKGLTPYILFTVTAPDSSVRDFIRQPPIDSNSDALVKLEYLFNMTGTYTIRAEVNPPIGKSYVEYNDLGTEEENNVGTLTITIQDKPKDEKGEWYELDEIRDRLEDEPIYAVGLVAAIVVIVVAVVMLVKMRKRRASELGPDENDEDDYQDEDDTA